MSVPYPLNRCSVGIMTRCCKSINWSENYSEVHVLHALYLGQKTRFYTERSCYNIIT